MPLINWSSRALCPAPLRPCSPSAARPLPLGPRPPAAARSLSAARRPRPPPAAAACDPPPAAAARRPPPAAATRSSPPLAARARRPQLGAAPSASGRDRRRRRRSASGAARRMEMAPAPVSSNPRTVEEIFKDFAGRRAALVRALTTDVEDFYASCDPDKENLCLYGLANGSWEVAPPAEEVPPEIPEPALGINFARDGMQRRDWLSLVAVHSDSWLISVAFFFGARLNANERKRLFSMINDLPSVFEAFVDRKHGRDRSGVDSNGKSRHSSKRSSDGHAKNSRTAAAAAAEEYEDDDEEHNETFCGTCGGRYNATEFWIGCDICERWFHGKCVKITPAKAEHIKHYKCPDCSSKKIRQ